MVRFRNSAVRILLAAVAIAAMGFAGPAATPQLPASPQGTGYDTTP